jgi:hypothetical protein
MSRTLFVLASVVFALDASATPNFPPAIRVAESLRSDPPCGLCHRGVEAAGTVTTPFGVSMRLRGLVMYDLGSLQTALAAMQSGAVDSDGDGVPDLEELRAGGDPNVPSTDGGQPAVTLPEPTYGCVAGDGVSLVPVAAIALALALRPRRSTRGRSASPSAYASSNVTSGRPNT